MKKTNAQHLKDILSKIESNIPQESIPELVEEANEFIEALEEELEEANEFITDQKDEIKKLEERNAELNSEIENREEEELENSVNLIQDTFSWSLKEGNLQITHDVEDFVEKLKNKYFQTV